MISLSELKRLLRYSKTTGRFTRLVSRRGGFPVGSIAGTLDQYGYIVISLGIKKYGAHRLAYFYVTGRWPVAEIDHKNGIRHDNRWRNLRDATRSINAQNLRSAPRHSRHKFLGVSCNGPHFRAAIKLDGKTIHLGTFKTQRMASAAYLYAKRLIHVGCTI